MRAKGLKECELKGNIFHYGVFYFVFELKINIYLENLTSKYSMPDKTLLSRGNCSLQGYLTPISWKIECNQSFINLTTKTSHIHTHTNIWSFVKSHCLKKYSILWNSILYPEILFRASEVSIT